MESKRLYIQPMMQDDCYEMFEYYQDPISFKYLDLPQVKEIDDMDIIYDLLYKDQDAYVLIAKDTGMIIGDVSFYQENNKLYVYYILDRNYWHQGFMTEALREILKQYHEVYATVFQDHQKSKKLLIKLGFTHEKILYEKHKVIDEFKYRKEG